VLPVEGQAARAWHRQRDTAVEPGPAGPAA
jgi:hypothetical protein